MVAKNRLLTVIATPGGKKQHVFTKKHLIGPSGFCEWLQNNLNM
jgi:hypothetical protein